MNEQYSRDENTQPGGQFSDSQQSAPRYASYASQSKAGESLFDSLRRSEVRRSTDRMLGGVLCGVSVRYGWDLTLLRVLTAVLAMFFPLTLAVYALAWMLLPEESDGRIHLEALTLGYFDVAHLGAAAMLLLGLTNTALYGTLVFFIGLPFVLLLGLLLIINGRSQPPLPPSPHHAPPATSASPAAWQNLATMRTSAPMGAGDAPTTAPATTEDSPTPPRPQAGDSTFNGDEAPTPTNGDDAESSADNDAESQGASEDWRILGGPQQEAPVTGSQSAAPMGSEQDVHVQDSADRATSFVGASPASAAWAPQAAYGSPYAVRPPMDHAPMRKRSLPLWVNLLVTGLLALIFAATEFLLYVEDFNLHAVAADYGRIILIAGGICLLLVAVPMIYAALTDRGAAWLISLSLIGMMIAAPTTLIGVSLQSADFGPRSFSRVLELSTPWNESTEVFHYTSDIDDLGSVINAHWDLSDVPNDGTQFYSVQTALGDLTIYVRQGQNVQINVAEQYGTIRAEYQPGSPEWIDTNSGILFNGSWSSNPNADFPSTIIEIHRSLGTLTVVELPASSGAPGSDSPANQPAVEAPQSTPAQDASQSAPAQDTRTSQHSPADQPASASRH